MTNRHAPTGQTGRRFVYPSAGYPAPWRSGYAAACKAVYTGSIPVGASLCRSPSPSDSCSRSPRRWSRCSGSSSSSGARSARRRCRGGTRSARRARCSPTAGGRSGSSSRPAAGSSTSRRWRSRRSRLVQSVIAGGLVLLTPLANRVFAHRRDAARLGRRGDHRGGARRCWPRRWAGPATPRTGTSTRRRRSLYVAVLTPARPPARRGGGRHAARGAGPGGRAPGCCGAAAT